MNAQAKAKKADEYSVNSSVFKESWSSEDGDNSSFISDSSNSDSNDNEEKRMRSLDRIKNTMINKDLSLMNLDDSRDHLKYYIAPKTAKGKKKKEIDYGVSDISVRAPTEFSDLNIERLWGI